MSGSDIDALERSLLSNPYDIELRLQYAAGLRASHRLDEAIVQFENVMKGEARKAAAAQVGIALCELEQGKEEQALDRYQRARALEGFEREQALERLLAKAQPSGPKLAVIQGGATVSAIRKDDDRVLRFADVAGMESLKKTLRLQIIEPFRNPGLFQRFRKRAGGGVLLYGPPGCGKTYIARAIAGECGAHYISVGISDVLNMWIGESERNLASIFEQARSRAPCLLFFDELDALAYSRSKAASSAARTVVNEFLAQLDGFAAAKDALLILAATNMPWDVDPAMKRPGRFARQVFVPPPDAAAREEMFRLKMRDVPSEPLDFAALAARTELFSGADIDGLIDLAKEHVLADILDSGTERALTSADFVRAVEEATPSTVEWLKTARNLVMFSGADSSYKDVEQYLKRVGKL